MSGNGCSPAMRGSCRGAAEGAFTACAQLAPSGPLDHLPRIAGEEIVGLTRPWLGTPYRHQASTLGAGCDCLGLVRGVWRALHRAEPEPAPPYRPDWAETGGRELLLEAFGRWLIPLPFDAARPGDVLVFRMAPGAVAKHCAIQSGPERMIHAYWGRACVESVLGRWWRERLAAAFRFPL